MSTHSKKVAGSAVIAVLNAISGGYPTAEKDIKSQNFSEKYNPLNLDILI